MSDCSGEVRVSDKVVNIAARRNAENDSGSSQETEESKEEFSFEEVMKRNKEKQEKLAKERAKDNNSVTRSYRLKK
jgi:hypothetical protein